jgi:hypothetical protein
MEEQKRKRGRPSRGIPTSAVVVRFPVELLQRIDARKEALAEQVGWPIARHEVILRLCEQALNTPEHTPVMPTSTAAVAIETPTPAPAKRSGELPAHIQRIAEARADYEKMSLADFSRLLYDRHIYRAKDRKTGEEKPVNRGTLQHWLDEAREAGLL